MREAIVIGAGPYGLSVAAHLESLGIDYVAFGKPVDTWINHMPNGMLLKSDGFASWLSGPSPESSLEAYCAGNGITYHHTSVPVQLKTFTDYAKSFQRKYVTHLDQRNVMSLTSNTSGFMVTLDDGSVVHGRRVVLCVGITHFSYIPSEFAHVGSSLISHSSDHKEMTGFHGKSVAVLGAGSSAVDLAVHLAEAGANVSLVARAPNVRFSGMAKAGGRSLWKRLRHPQSGLGSGLRSRIFSDYPHLFRFLPAKLRLEIVKRHLGPSSPEHLEQPFYAKVNVMTGCAIQNTRAAGTGVELSIRGKTGQKTEISVDHVIAATGYRVDLKRLPFLDSALCDAIEKVGQYPKLNANMETSVPGLYCSGIAAAASFGPLMRFVYGSDFAAKRISRALKQKTSRSS